MVSKFDTIELEYDIKIKKKVIQLQTLVIVPTSFVFCLN